MPDLFSYSDYRKFLRDWIDYARDAGLTNITKLADKIGVHTTFLGHVLRGDKNLSFEHAAEISKAISLTEIETEYFFSVLQIERAGTKTLREYWTNKKNKILVERAQIRSRVGEHHELSIENRAIFFSSWIYSAIFVSTGIDDGQTLDQIANRFHLSRERAEEILSFLVKVRICDAVGPIYKMGQSRIFIGNESPLIIKHHINWRIQGLRRLDMRRPDELFFTSPMSISPEDFTKIREVLSKSIESSLAICKDSPAKEVVSLNIDFFRLDEK